MLKNYLRIAFRSLWRNKSHSLINILGLGLGIAVCVLIALFIKDEWTFDAFHSKANRIYRASVKENWGKDQEFFNTVTPFPLGPALNDNFEEVESQVRILSLNTSIKNGDAQFNESITVAGQDFFLVFDFPQASGDLSSALKTQNGAVLTQRYAEKYFGSADPIGKSLAIQVGEAFEEFEVKAVVSTVPTNSSIQFDVLISDLNFVKLFNERVLTSAWFNVNPETYILLREDVDKQRLEAKFPSLFKTLLGEEDFTQSKYEVGLQPITDIHLNTAYPTGAAPVSNPRYSYILAAIAVLILAVACINFVTLSVGRSIKRAKEIGVRKVVGALRLQLAFQFVGEAVIVTSISVAVGALLAYVCLPLFNDLSGKSLTFPVDQFLAVVVISLLIIIGVIAGSYPAFVLSSLKPTSVLKGGISIGSSKQSVRRVLVGVQLVFSIFLISSTLIMRSQLHYLQNKNLGFDKEQLMVVQLNVPRVGRLPERVAKGFEIAEQFKSELKNQQGVAAICASAHDFGNGAWTNLGFTDEKGVYRTFFMNVVDGQYLPAMKMELTAGRNFSDSIPADKRRSVIVNEAFAKEYGWKDAIGKRLPGSNFQDHEVIGVVKDFNYASLYTSVQPLVMVQNPAITLSGAENINIDNTPLPKLLIRLEPGDMLHSIEKVKQTWIKITGLEEFSFSFADQALATQYKNDTNLGKIVRMATVLAVIIGSLGLYGLASLALQNRIKEMSIRKVLGATERSLLILLSKEYIFLVIMCLMISIPATWYVMNEWLKSFEYKVAITGGNFIAAGLVAVVIAFFTIGYQLIKTILAQPADTLKYE